MSKPYIKEFKHTLLDLYNQGKNARQLSLEDEVSYSTVLKWVQGVTPDVIICRAEFPISCSISTLYRLFKQGLFDLTALPMKGKRKANGYKEKRSKQVFKRTIHQRNRDYQLFNNEEADPKVTFYIKITKLIK